MGDVLRKEWHMNAANGTWGKRTKFSAFIAAGIVCLAVGMCPQSPTLTPQAAVAPPQPPAKILAPPLFNRWPQDRKPDLAIILTGEQHSYIKFCGCSNPQLGGFERRANFINQLKAKGWPIVALDLGDLVYRKTGSLQAQTLLKYKASMQALDLLGYSAIGLGEHEFNLPLIDGLAEYTLQKPDANPKVLAANLQDRANNFPTGNGKGSMIGDTVVIKGNGNIPTIGTLALIGPSVQQNIADPQHKFADNKQVIASALAAFDKANVIVRVLLYQGTPDEATNLAKAFPEFHLILCKCPQEEPPVQPTMVDKTMIVMVGWKGRKIGIGGIFRDAVNPKKFELHWEVAPLGDEYETPPGEVASNPMLKIMEEYAQQVKNQNLLLQYAKTPHPLKTKYPAKNVEFVGSNACQNCHKEDFAIWQHSKHSHAYATLEHEAKKPSLRQFDGECVVCHTVGFTFNSGFKSEQLTPNLKDVGCENCHGPASLHVAAPNDKNYYPDLSPWKSKPTDRVMLADGKYDNSLLLKIDSICQKCHDTDSDPDFRFEKEKYWPQIKHGKKPAPAAAINGAAVPKK
jgi:Cytochrome c554 and c-prime